MNHTETPLITTDPSCSHHETRNTTATTKIKNHSGDSEESHHLATAITTTTTTTIVLFYKYFIPSRNAATMNGTNTHGQNHPSDHEFYYIHNYSDYYLPRLRQYIQDACSLCHVEKGRILIATEGINGTISTRHDANLQQFIGQMESLDVLQQFGHPPDISSPPPESATEFLFQNIDWKTSTAPDQLDPFPDLKISIVTEIISTGVTGSTNSGITLEDMVQYGGGIHLTPTEFHTMIEQENDNVILFDIRNTFEHQIGHFVHPHTRQAAIHPKDMVQFSTLPSILQQTIFNSSADTTTKTDGNGDDTTNRRRHTENPIVEHHDSDTNEATLPPPEEWTNKKILLYCTGGIRCEKASVMFQKLLSTNGPDDTNQENPKATTSRSNTNVYQLSGGIHRYIEQYGSTGYFKGKNFVFDQRIVQDPSDYDSHNDSNGKTDVEPSEQTVANVAIADNLKEDDDPNVVGRCIECCQQYDVLSGSRICTVCRDLVLVCTSCQSKLREYHCSRHQIFKTCYFTFLEVYTKVELQQQYDELTKLRDGYLQVQPQSHQQDPTMSKEQLSKKYKNVRRTLNKQMMKVKDRIHDLETGSAECDRNAARRCRTCFEPNTICDGKCWGFWKRSFTSVVENGVNEPMLPELTIGTKVEPGPHWNESRFGSKYDNWDENQNNDQPPTPQLRRGYVVDVKTWGSNSTEYDSVAVSWCTSASSIDATKLPSGAMKTAVPLIYRWGVLARNGQRMYDLQRVEDA